MWKHHFRHWFNAEEINALNEYNQQFEAPNLERELILTHFRPTRPGETGIFVTTSYILNRINSSIRQPLSPTKIGMLMKELGFKRVRCGKQRGYRAYEYTYDEIAQNRQRDARNTQNQEKGTVDDPMLF